LRFSIQIPGTKTEQSKFVVATPTVTPTNRTKLPSPHFFIILIVLKISIDYPTKILQRPL